MQGTERVQKVGVRTSDHGGKTRKLLHAENGDITGTTMNGHFQTFTAASPRRLRKYKIQTEMCKTKQY